MSWHVGRPTPAEFVDKESPESVRVTHTNGSTLYLTSPVIRGDSLVGTTHGGAQFSLPLSEVRSVAVEKVSARKTVGLVAAGFLVVVAMMGATECSGEGFGIC
jgi:hypothetical protein